jgi:uncharacterized membrane protein
MLWFPLDPARSTHLISADRRWGAVSGSASLKLTGSTGVDDPFLNEPAEIPAPGSSALFMAVRKADRTKVREKPAGFGGKGKVLVTSVSAERRAELHALLDSKEPGAPATN